MAIGRKDIAREVLSAHPNLNPHVESILSALDSAGLLDRPNTESIHAVGGQMSAAAAASRKTYLGLARGELHRIGIELKDGLTVHQINDALCRKNVAPEQRIRIKSVLHAAGVID